VRDRLAEMARLRRLAVLLVELDILWQSAGLAAIGAMVDEQGILPFLEF
jgi:hypothetical protein